MTVELDRHKINEFSLKITSLLHWKTTAQLLLAVLSHEFHSRSPAGNRPLKKISHANSFFFCSEHVHCSRTVSDEIKNCNCIFLKINKRWFHFLVKLSYWWNESSHNFSPLWVSLKNYIAIALGATIPQQRKKIFSPHVNSSQKKLTCKQLVFSSEHVYEYEETDEERAKRRKMAVIEEDIRCFE